MTERHGRSGGRAVEHSADTPKSSLRTILEMIRFSHTLFALPFALLAAAMAWATPLSGGARVSFRWQDFLGIVLCMVAARSAAMAFNRLVDRHLDADNPRTAGRHLVTGELNASYVTWFTIICVAIFIASTALFLPNRLPLILSVPVILFLLGYSYTKRFTALAHFWLGAALMLAPVCAWIAIRGAEVQTNIADLIPAAILGLAVMLWVGGFDIIYACQDQAYDAKVKLQSVPAKVGIAWALRVAALSHLAMVVVLACLPWAAPQLGFGLIYGLGVAGVAVLLTIEHRLVRPDDLTRVNIAFAQVNMVISIGLLAVGVADLYIG